MHQAARLRERSRPGANDGLDYDNLAEEIESLGRSDRRAIKSHMRVLLAHLLKWRHQSDKRSKSWNDSIFNARLAITDLLEDSPSLVRCADEIVAEAYKLAVRDAVSETQLSKDDFPSQCPFTEAQILGEDFLPTDLDGA